MDEKQSNQFFRTSEPETPSTTEYFDFSEAVAGARNGDKAAQETLYQKSYALLEREARKEYDRPEDVEDILQEVYLRIFKSVDQLKDPKRFLGWALVIGKRTILEQKTRKGKYDHLVEPWPETSEAGEPSLDLLPAEEYRKDRNPDLYVDATHVSTIVQSIIDDLPEVQQMCLLLWMEGYRYQEIADELGVPLGTVKGNMNRAKTKVRDTLEGMRKEGTFDYNAVSTDPVAAFLYLLERYVAGAGGLPTSAELLLPKVQTALAAGDVLTSGGKLASLSRKSSTAVLSVLMVLVMAVGLALGIQSRSSEMTVEPATQKTTRVTRTQAEETTASTTAPGGIGPTNNGAGETPAFENTPVPVQTPAPAGTNGGDNAGGTNATTAVVQQAAAGSNGPLTAQVANISDVPGGNLLNGVAGLGSDIADNITIQTPVIDSDIFSLNDSDSDNIKLYFFVRNHMGRPIMFKGYKMISFQTLLGKEFFQTKINLDHPLSMDNGEESWFVVNISRNQYELDPMVQRLLEAGTFTTTLKENYTFVT